MHPDATDDLQLLAERLRLGLPLREFDGREIPLRTVTGECIDAIEAANALLLSGASLLSADYADAYVMTVLARAGAVESPPAWPATPRPSSRRRSPRCSSARPCGPASSPAGRMSAPAP